MEKFLDIVEQIWSIAFVQFIVYLVIAFVAAGLSKFIVTKLLKLVKLDKKLDKWGVNEGQLGTSMSFVGKLVYIIVFLLFLPSALGALGLTGVSDPITGFAATFIEYLPNIIASIIIVYVGIFVAKIIGQIVSVLLKKTKLDNLLKKADGEPATILLSDIIVKILMGVIILITFVQAFIVLGIEAISAPAMSIVSAIFGAIPSIILAIVIIACGMLIANIACGLLGNVLVGVNFDSLVKKLIPQLKFSATKVVVNVVRGLIILFVVAQGIEVLNLGVLTSIATSVIAYLPLVIKALLIAFVAFVGASMLESFLVKNAKAAKLAGIAKVAIYTLAGFMVLSQLGIASTIVNAAFIIIMIALAGIAILAFGVGGQDFAKKTFNRVDEKIEKCKSENNEVAEADTDKDAE